MARNFAYSFRTVGGAIVGEKSRTNHHRNGLQVGKAHARHPSREVGGVEMLEATARRFDVENDDDVRDAVVADIVD